MPRPQNAISNSLEDFQGGSPYPGGTGKVLEFKYVLWDYDGKRPVDSQVAVFFKFQPTDGSNGGKEEPIYWSVGPAADFQPSPDGGFLIPTGVRNTQSSSSNWAFVLKAMRDSCGLEAEKLNDDLGLRAIEGSELTLVRIPQPERDGLEQDKSADGQQAKKFKPTILSPTKAKWAWEARGGAGRSAAPAATPINRGTTNAASPAPANGNSTVTDKTDPAEVLQFILESAGGTIAIADIPKAAQNAMVNADKAVRLAVLKKLKADTDEICVGSGWNYNADAGTVSL